MKNDWAVQYAILNSSPDIQVNVQWDPENDVFTARLDNWGRFVNIVEDNGMLLFAKGRAKSGPEAISELFRVAVHKTLQVEVRGEDTKLLLTERGYAPA